jgi:CheY-like chemotaxis protein
MGLNHVRALVVDDIDINLVIGEEILRSYGAEVEVAFSGIEALEMIEKTEYDIIFMDHMMPKMDGLDTTKLIREKSGDYYKNVPIIALTANVVGDVRSMFLECGMNDFLSKPLEYNEIERVFKEWLPKEKWSLVS